jgi:hypothetical protein
MQMMQVQRLKEPSARRQTVPWSHFQCRTERIPPHEYGELTPRSEKNLLFMTLGSYGIKHRNLIFISCYSHGAFLIPYFNRQNELITI